MSYKYVICDSEAKMSLCMSANYMCRKFYLELINPHSEDKGKAGEKSIEINCVAYAFTREGLLKYGFGKKIRNLGEEEARKIAII